MSCCDDRPMFSSSSHHHHHHSTNNPNNRIRNSIMTFHFSTRITIITFFRLFSTIHLTFGHCTILIFLSQFFTNSIKPFLFYFLLDTVSTCLFSQLQSLFISHMKSGDVHFRMSYWVRILFAILLFLYHVIGIGFLVYYLTEIVRHIRISHIMKETFEYDADYEIYSPLFVDLRLTSFFCLIPMILGFGRVLQHCVMTFLILLMNKSHNDSTHEHLTTSANEIPNSGDHGFSWVETIAFWIGSILSIYTCFYQFSSIYFAFYQISVYWMEMSVIVMLIGCLGLFFASTEGDNVHCHLELKASIAQNDNDRSITSTTATNTVTTHDDENHTEEEEEEHTFTEIFSFLKMYFSIFSFESTLQNWADLFLNARVYENQSLILLFLLTLDIHPLVVVFFLIEKGCDLLTSNYQANQLWTLQSSYQSTIDRNSSVSIYSILYHTFILVVYIALTSVNSLPINYIGYQKVVYGTRDHVVFGCSILIPVLLSQVEGLLFSSGSSHRFTTGLIDRKELVYVLTIKRYLAIVIQLIVTGIICLVFDDPGLMTFKFFSDVSLMLQIAAFICLCASYVLSFCHRTSTKEKAD